VRRSGGSVAWPWQDTITIGDAYHPTYRGWSSVVIPQLLREKEQVCCGQAGEIAARAGDNMLVLAAAAPQGTAASQVTPVASPSALRTLAGVAAAQVRPNHRAL